MRPFTSTITVADALARLAAAAVPVTRVETVDLAHADGRVIAADVRAGADVPPFDRALMDGYAVRAADTAGASPSTPRTLRRTTAVHAGDPGTVTVVPGTCVEISTGAPLPSGADAVVMVEHTSERDGDVSIEVETTAGQNVGLRGGDIGAGQLALAAGEALTPGRVGVLAALGHDTVRVYVRPRVALISTGNELVAPGRPLGPGQIHDVNRHTLAAIVRRHGGEPVTHDLAADSIDDITAALDRAAPADLLVFSGGSSVGNRDLVIDVLRTRGEVIFHGIAVKPGKPTAFGRIGGTPVLGMPGNPTSCLSNACVFLVPLLRAIGRLPPHAPRTARLPLARAIGASDRHQFVPVMIENGQAVPVFKGSGAITSMSRADGYISIEPRTTTLDVGTDVEVVCF